MRFREKNSTSMLQFFRRFGNFRFFPQNEFWSEKKRIQEILPISMYFIGSFLILPRNSEFVVYLMFYFVVQRY